MKTIITILALAAAIVIPLGPKGRAALSSLTGLEVIGGAHVLYGELTTTIEGIGIKNGEPWKFTVIWRGGKPVVTNLHNIKSGV